MASPEAYQAKLDSVAKQIQNLNLTDAQKEVFLNELNTKPWEADWSKAFTNDYLQGDRCAEGLFHLAKGLESSGNQTLIPDLNYDTLKSIAGTTVHSSKERVFGIGLELTDKVGQEVTGSGSTWWIPITGFANTFKNTKIEESEVIAQTQENKDQNEYQIEVSQNDDRDIDENRVPETSDLGSDISSLEQGPEKLLNSEQKIVEKHDFNIDNLNFKDNLYVIHQTSSKNAASILSDGLRT